MITPSPSSSPTLSKSCQCFTQLFCGQTLFRSPSKTGYGCHMKQQRRQFALVCAVQRKSPPATSSTTKANSQPTQQNAQYRNAPRLTSAASVNLMQALAGSAIFQGFKQLQNTFDQLQQTGNKLTKGFSQRPLGFPPGAALALYLTVHLCLQLQADTSPSAASMLRTLNDNTMHFACTTVLYSTVSSAAD